MKVRVDGLPDAPLDKSPVTHEIVFERLEYDDSGYPTAVYRYVPPAAPQSPPTANLLVEVSEPLAEEVAAYLAGHVNGVVSVSEHGSGCCCKNCPWNGDHRLPAERRPAPGRALEPCEREIDCPDCQAKAGSPCRHLTSYMHDDVLKNPHRTRYVAWAQANGT